MAAAKPELVPLAGRGTLRVRYVLEVRRFAPAMPEWGGLVLTWNELGQIAGRLAAAPAQGRGVYLTFDVRRQQGYVGSACGGENLIGRSRNYADTGHGGNIGLRGSRPDDLRFSILKLTVPTAAPDVFFGREKLWKQRLHTRTCRLNAN